MNAERLNMEEIERRLKESEAGCSLFYRETVGSTNDWAKEEGFRGAPEKSIYLAERQEAGRGRRGRAWESPAGTSLYMSLLLRPEIKREGLSMLTLVMGLAAALGIREASGLKAEIKWPNDVVHGGKKLCGILTELSLKGNFVVIGIGINVNTEQFPEELRSRASSLYRELGRKISREGTAAAVLAEFFRRYRRFLETEDLKLLREDYDRLLVNRGRHVRVLDLKDPFEGTALGISDQGELLVRREDTGGTEAVFAGEVSVRGVYGYV